MVEDPQKAPDVGTHPPTKEPTEKPTTPGPTARPTKHTPEPTIIPCDVATSMELLWDDILKLEKALEELIGVDGRFLIPQFVRNSFRDCIGGCDGCINMEEPSNKGLRGTWDFLDTLHRQGMFALCFFFSRSPFLLFFSRVGWEWMSRSDFWATMGTVALRLAAKMQGGERPFIPEFPFYFGRKDCCHSKAPNYDQINISPNPHGNRQETIGFFKSQFGLSTRQAVALLGGHTLGRVRERNSGFRGKWTIGKESDENSMYTLDNMYYRNLVDPRLFW